MLSYSFKQFRRIPFSFQFKTRFKFKIKLHHDFKYSLFFLVVYLFYIFNIFANHWIIKYENQTNHLTVYANEDDKLIEIPST